MKALKIWPIVLGAAYLFSCSPCSQADAIVSKYSFRFQIRDKITGNNLIFGPTATLDLKKFKLYSLLKTDTIFYPLIPSQELGWVSQTGDVYSEINPPTSELILLYSDKTRDNLSLTFSQRETECWGLITNITSVTRNQTEFFENVNETLDFTR